MFAHVAKPTVLSMMSRTFVIFRFMIICTMLYLRYVICVSRMPIKLQLIRFVSIVFLFYIVRILIDITITFRVSSTDLWRPIVAQAMDVIAGIK